MGTERTYKKGDRIKVQSHRVKVGDVTMVVESFCGTFLKEFVGSDGKTYVDLWGEGQYPGQRAIQKQFVHGHDEPIDAPEYDGENYIIRCQECGDSREIKPQHLGQVLRCKRCQKKHNREMAKKRAKRRYRDKESSV
jgi:hypothetical protein